MSGSPITYRYLPAILALCVAIVLLPACQKPVQEVTLSWAKSGFDSAYLWRRLDTMEYYAGLGDSVGCHRLLNTFNTEALARSLPSFVYQIYYYATADDDWKLKGVDSTKDTYVADRVNEFRALAKRINSEQLTIYSEYLPMRRISNAGYNQVALPAFLDQLARFEKIGDRYGQGILTKRIGMVYLRSYRQYEKAAVYFKKAYNVSPGEVEQMDNTGLLINAYFELRNKDSLDKYYRRFSTYVTYNTPGAIAEAGCAYHILRYATSNQGSTDSVDKYLGFLLNHWIADPDEDDLNDLLRYLPVYCDALIDRGQFARAAKLLDKTTMLATNKKFVVDNSIALYKSCNHYYEAVHNIKKAYYYLQLYNETNEKLRLDDKKNAVELARIDYQVSLQKKQSLKELQLIDKDRKLQTLIRNVLIVAFILLVILIIVLINRTKLQRTIEMERMRGRLSRDLHDDIGSTLSSINILSRTAQTHMQQADERTKASLEKINDRSQRLLDSMSDIIWNIKPGSDTIEEVMSRMREYAATMLEAKQIDYTFNFPKEKMDCKLTMDVKNNMYLIFKEAVNNLSKYSGCTHASLSLTFDEKHIHLVVEDNGNGFEEALITHKGGLRNMQQRAEEIKGTLDIQAQPGKGVRIALTMPRYC